MKNRIIAISLIAVLLLMGIPLTSCGFLGDPMLDDMWTRNIYPGTTNTYDVGSLAYQYQNGYFQNLFIGGVPVIPGGGGDVVGTPPSTDDAIARYDGITGLLIQNSAVTISDAGIIDALIGRSVTLTVAAIDSSATSIAQSDYQCDGAADDTEINAALNALPALGGRVILLEGTYTLADPIVIPKFNVTLEGQGTLPLIDGDGLATTEHAITMNNKDNVIIRNLSIQTENGGGKDSSCIIIEDGSDNFMLDGVTFIDSDTHAIVIGGTSISDGRIINCHVVNGDEHGIYLDMDGGSTARYITIAGNIIEHTSGDGIRIWSTGSQDYFIINSNIISSVGGSAMYIYDLQGFTIADNNIETPTGYGMRLNNCQFGTISSNSFYNTGADGILTEASGDTTITGNDIDTTLTAGTSDCIQVNGNSNTITSNYLKDPERNGIRVVGVENVVGGNDIIDADQDGIYVSGSENLISDNVITSPGREAAGTYDGITLDASSDRCSIVDNVITDAGTITEHGIHVNDGATEVKVSDNYIFNLMGSGIVLVANNDDCQITNNYVQDCDDYGVYIVAATCDDTTLIGNTLQGNVTGEYLDNGTDTGTFFEKVILVGNAKTINAVWVDAGGIKSPGLKPATAIAHGNLETPAWQFANQALIANQESISFNIRIPERMDRSVAPTLCIGWSTAVAGAGNTKWQLEYLWTSPDESTVAAAQETLTTTVAASANANGLVVSSVAGIDLPSATDACMHCKITRLSADGADTIAGTTELSGICFSWTSNKLGG